MRGRVAHVATPTYNPAVMRSETVVTTDSGLVVIHDGGASPGGNDGFYLQADDPVRWRIVLTDEGLPPDLEPLMEPTGGSFLLRVPSGALSIDGAHEVAVPRGSYALRLYARRPFDGRRYDDRMIAALGRRDWQFRKRMDVVGAAGCALPLLLVPLWLIRSWRPWLGYGVIAIVAFWALYLLLQRLPRYRAIESRRRDVESAMPHFVIALAPIANEEGLVGGGIRV